MNYLTFEKRAAQGDIFITKIDSLPKDLREMKHDDNQYIVAHSETGHHHTLPTKGVKVYEASNDPFVLYVAIDNEYADLTHNRSFDTHAPIRLKNGVYRINRQREYTPEGWRRVAD